MAHPPNRAHMSPPPPLASLLITHHLPTRTLAVELAELKSERARALESRTLAGHVKNALGYAMSIYCVYK